VHNLRGYDSHFIVKHYKLRKNTPVSGLACNTQKFRTLDIGKISFVDSLSLLDAGLAELVRDLGADHPYPIIEDSGIYENNHQKSLLLNGKGIYPYEYIESFATLSEPTLPPIEAFYSSLREETVSLEDYNRALETFHAFNCQSLSDYTRLYCHLDVLQLAEIMFEFIAEVQTDFGLDVTNYISIPQLSFDAMLKMTGVKLDHITDMDMALCLENGIRGGVSYVSTRSVDIDRDGGEIGYFDYNNLYGWAQRQKLPVSDYAWVPDDELETLDITQIPDDADTGYILEVDLEYPTHIRDKHRHMPMAPEHLDIFHPDLSEYSKQCLNVTQLNRAARERYHSHKLCGTFYPKKKYLVHYRNLKFYLKHGLVVTKTHRIISFRQSAFTKDYIDFCGEKRRTAISPFKQRMAKLYVNGNFGKFIQNVRKYINVKFVKKEALAAKYVGRPNFICFRVLTDSLVVIFLKQKSITLDRTFSIGFSILELSKLLMFECFYDIILPRFHRKNVDLILSDTDSFILHLRNHSKRDIQIKLRDIMDFSNLKPNHEFYDTSRAKVPGYLKDEIPNGRILECVAPKSKCYALRSETNSVTTIEKKCKGITKPRVKRLKIESYRECIVSKVKIKATMSRIRVKDHAISTVLQHKICLSSFDDKRYLLRCGKHSYPYQIEPLSDKCPRCRI